MRYFDYNATAPLDAAAREAWLNAVAGEWANPSGLTRLSARAHNRLKACRAAWAGSFSVEPEQVVFMGSATGVNNAVVAHVAERSPPDSWIAVSAVEHPCVLAAAERYFGSRVARIEVDAHGRVDLEGLSRILAAHPVVLVAVMAANNETGVLQPIDAIADQCREGRVLFLCDAAQWMGKMPAAGLPKADYISWSAHKFGGPRGVGGLLLGERSTPFRGHVGGKQQNGFQAGTEDVAGIAAMTAAFAAQPATGWSFAGRDAFLDALGADGFTVLGAAAARLPNTVSLLVPRHPAPRWIAHLEKRGWIVASGSACSSGQGSVSHVLRALGLDRFKAGRVLRISGGPEASVEVWQELRVVLGSVLDALDAEANEPSLTTVVEI